LAGDELNKIAQIDEKRVTDRLFRKLFLLAISQVSLRVLNFNRTAIIFFKLKNDPTTALRIVSGLESTAEYKKINMKVESILFLNQKSSL
jgi:hypothetical protein